MMQKIVAEHLKSTLLPSPNEGEILIVEIGGEDFEPSVDDMDEIRDLFVTALDAAGSKCPAVVVFNKHADVKARALKIQEAVALAAEMAK